METPPPKLCVCDDDAAQPVWTREQKTTLKEMATSALPTETNTAPPAALLPPGLQDDDDEDAMLLLKLQLKNVKLEDRVTAEDVDEDLGYAYDSNDAETAPPTEKASFEKPDVDELLLQCAHDALKNSIIHDEMNKPETVLEPPPLYE
jgi:hypothetical protein